MRARSVTVGRLRERTPKGKKMAADATDTEHTARTVELKSNVRQDTPDRAEEAREGFLAIAGPKWSQGVCQERSGNGRLVVPCLSFSHEVPMPSKVVLGRGGSALKKNPNHVPVELECGWWRKQ